MVTQNMNRHRLLYSNLLLVAAMVLVAFAAMATLGTQCASAAAGSCSVGDDEVFSDNIGFDSGTTFRYTLDHAITANRTLVLPDADVAKGSIAAGTAANTLGLLTIGANDLVLIADSAQTTGMKWGTFVSDTTFLDKTADETVNNSDSLQSDDDLTFSVTANKNYSVWGVLIVDSGSTPDIKVQWSLPSAAVAEGNILINFAQTNWGRFVESTDVVLDGAGAGTPEGHAFTGVIKVGANAGTAVIQWAQNTANGSDTKLLEGSWMAFRQLN